MSKQLVAYFSASGSTARAAKVLAQAISADLYEIKPKEPYTHADLDWRNKQSRSSQEQRGIPLRPAIVEDVPDLTDYRTVFVGFPIWWYTAPSIVMTFLEACDLTGKKVALFATSGGSDLGNTQQKLAASCPGASIVSGRMLNGRLDTAALKAWADSL